MRSVDCQVYFTQLARKADRFVSCYLKACSHFSKTSKLQRAQTELTLAFLKQARARGYVVKDMMPELMAYLSSMQRIRRGLGSRPMLVTDKHVRCALDRCRSQYISLVLKTWSMLLRRIQQEDLDAPWRQKKAQRHRLKKFLLEKDRACIGGGTAAVRAKRAMLRKINANEPPTRRDLVRLLKASQPTRASMEHALVRCRKRTIAEHVRGINMLLRTVSKM